jgi:TATA-binding protein-associated factor Taf7
MFVLHDPSEEDPELNCDSAHKLFDGITPPTRNIRKRKFRKVEEKRVLFLILLEFSYLSRFTLDRRSTTNSSRNYEDY